MGQRQRIPFTSAVGSFEGKVCHSGNSPEEYEGERVNVWCMFSQCQNQNKMVTSLVVGIAHYYTTFVSGCILLPNSPVLHVYKRATETRYVLYVLGYTIQSRPIKMHNV